MERKIQEGQWPASAPTIIPTVGMHTEQGVQRAKGAPLDAFMLSPPFTLPLPTAPLLCLFPFKSEQSGIFPSLNNTTTFYQSKYYNKSLFLPPSSLSASPASPIPRSVYPARITGLFSSWHYKLTSDTTNQLKGSPLCARTCRYTQTRSCYNQSTTAAEMPAAQTRQPGSSLSRGLC